MAMIMIAGSSAADTSDPIGVLILFAVLGGMQAFGFVGLVIGPLVFSLLMSIIDIYKKSFSIRSGTVTGA